MHLFCVRFCLCGMFYCISFEFVWILMTNAALLKSGKRKKLRSQIEMEIAEDTSSEYMADCCPSLCYFCCSFCKADENPVLWQNWADVRCRLYCFVETRLFRAAVCVVILTSIAMLVCLLFVFIIKFPLYDYTSYYCISSWKVLLFVR